jgi:hypothetical protein
MLVKHRVQPEYNQIYLKNLSLEKDEYLNWGNVNIDSGYHANSYEIAVFVEDIDVPVLRHDSITVLVAYEEEVSLSYDLIQIYQGDFFCKGSYLVLCNPFTVNSSERVKIDVSSFANQMITVNLFVDRTLDATTVCFFLTRKSSKLVPPPILNNRSQN